MTINIKSDVFGDRNYDVESIGHVLKIKPYYYRDDRKWCVAFAPTMRRYLVTDTRVAAYLMNCDYINHIHFIGSEDNCIDKAKELTDLFLRFD